jgi:DeoR family transcriptional regulator of aga operon
MLNRMGLPLAISASCIVAYEASAFCFLEVKIAKAAAAMVSEGQCIMPDSGTTTREIARSISCLRHIRVITNALNIAADLARSDFEVIMIGGTLRKNTLSVVGPLADDVLKEMHADIVFLGVDGFDH